MLQRAQTVYFLLSIICLGLMYAFDVAEIAVPEYTIFFKAMGLTAGGEAYDAGYAAKGYIVLLPIVILNVIYSLVLFRQRPKQIKWTGLSLLLNLILIVYAVFIITDIQGSNRGEDTLYDVSFYLPIASACFLLLAMRGIRKDEKLVKSLDRLR